MDLRFSGKLNIEILDAQELPLPCIGRNPTLDPYVRVDVDEILFASTTVHSKTLNAHWNEAFTESVIDGEILGLTVFHSSLIPPDPFIAHATISLAELSTNRDETRDVWVSYNGIIVYLCGIHVMASRILHEICLSVELTIRAVIPNLFNGGPF